MIKPNFKKPSINVFDGVKTDFSPKKTLKEKILDFEKNRNPYDDNYDFCRYVGRKLNVPTKLVEKVLNEN